MTLVEAIQNLTALVTQMAQAQQPAEQSAAIQQMTADVAALKDQMAALNSAQQIIIGAQATHSEQLSGLAQQLQANSDADAENAAADKKLRDAIGDVSQLG